MASSDLAETTKSIRRSELLLGFLEVGGNVQGIYDLGSPVVSFRGNICAKNPGSRLLLGFLEVGGNVQGIYDLRAGRFLSEAIFVPKIPGVDYEEDDGYLIFFTHDMTIDSELKCKEVPTSFGFDTACKV